MATITPATTAKKAPIADSPAPGPTYAMASWGKKQDNNMKKTIGFIK